jgi:hypothetical protein
MERQPALGGIPELSADDDCSGYSPFGIPELSAGGCQTMASPMRTSTFDRILVLLLSAAVLVMLGSLTGTLSRDVLRFAAAAFAVMALVAFVPLLARRVRADDPELPVLVAAAPIILWAMSAGGWARSTILALPGVVLLSLTLRATRSHFGTRESRLGRNE